MKVFRKAYRVKSDRMNRMFYRLSVFRLGKPAPLSALVAGAVSDQFANDKQVLLDRLEKALVDGHTVSLEGICSLRVELDSCVYPQGDQWKCKEDSILGAKVKVMVDERWEAKLYEKIKNNIELM